jgi:hypothetical protein
VSRYDRNHADDLHHRRREPNLDHPIGQMPMLADFRKDPKHDVRSRDL